MYSQHAHIYYSDLPLIRGLSREEDEAKKLIHSAFESVDDMTSKATLLDELYDESEYGWIDPYDSNPFIFTTYHESPNFWIFDWLIDGLAQKRIDEIKTGKYIFSSHYLLKKYPLAVYFGNGGEKLFFSDNLCGDIPILSSFQNWLDNIQPLTKESFFDLIRGGTDKAYKEFYNEVPHRSDEQARKEYDRSWNAHVLEMQERATNDWRRAGFPYNNTFDEYMRFNDLLNPMIVTFNQHKNRNHPYLSTRWATLLKMIFAYMRLDLFDKKHTYIVGRTGSGKTELLKSIFHCLDKEKKVVIDPHGEFARDIKNIEQNARYVNFAKKRFVINPFDINDKSPENRELVAQEITNLIGELIEDSSLSRLMETIIFPVIYTMLKLPYADLSMLRDMLHPTEGREKLEALATRAEAHHKTLFAGLLADTYDSSKTCIFNRLQSILNYRAVLRTVCGRDDFESAMQAMTGNNSENALIFSLPIPDLGESVSQTIGRVLMTRLQVWARRRNNIPERDRTPVFLFVDEFQNFLSHATAQTLDQFGRKFGLNMILAHQHIGQITSTEIKGSVLANTKIKIAGKSNDTTRQALAKEMGISASDLDTVETGYFYMSGHGDTFKFYNVTIKQKDLNKQERIKVETQNKGDDIPDGWDWIPTKNTAGTQESASEKMQDKPKMKPKFDL